MIVPMFYQIKYSTTVYIPAGGGMVSDSNTLVNCIFRTVYMAMAFNFIKIELFANYK